MEKDKPLSWSEEYLGVNVNKAVIKTTRNAYLLNMTAIPLFLAMNGAEIGPAKPVQNDDLHVPSQTQGSNMLETPRIVTAVTSIASAYGIVFKTFQREAK